MNNNTDEPRRKTIKIKEAYWEWLKKESDKTEIPIGRLVENLIEAEIKRREQEQS